jgi:hypothetical protein
MAASGSRYDAASCSMTCDLDDGPQNSHARLGEMRRPSVGDLAVSTRVEGTAGG